MTTGIFLGGLYRLVVRAELATYDLALVAETGKRFHRPTLVVSSPVELARSASSKVDVLAGDAQ